MTDPNGSAAGGQPGADGGAGGNTQAPWYGADAGDEIKGFVELKGWNDPKAAITSYQNLEKLLGADKAGRAVVWPKDDGDTDAWNQVYSKLGRPEKPDDYKLPVPEGANDAFAKAIAPKMHELGLSSKQAAGLAEFVNAYEQQQMQAYEAQSKAASEKAIADFKAELGNAFGPTVELGKRAAAALGVNEQQFAGLEEVLGLKGTVELFASIGKKLGEDTFVDGNGNPDASKLSPAAAQVRLQQLLADKDWVAKYTSGDSAARALKDQLDAAIVAGMNIRAA
jgi:hypothetical protein